MIACIHAACAESLPCKNKSDPYSDLVIPGWNDYVKDKHSEARNAFLDWVLMGKPRYGPAYHWMRKTRSQFKLALRYCRQHEDSIRCDFAAASLANKDYNKFWSSIRKTNNNNASRYANVIDGCNNDVDIADRWRVHFEQLYNSIAVDESKNIFFSRFSEVCNQPGHNEFVITVHDLQYAYRKQKFGKAQGSDGVHMESIVYGGTRLCVHLCILFNLFLKFGVLPKSFMHSVIVPLVKNKTGNLSDINNYRAIAICSAFCKIFETVIADCLHSVSEFDKFQFGFKPQHSTSVCTKVFKDTVDYYRSRGSHVFTCFVDFKKAFDNVNYWKLLIKLIDDNVNRNIIKVMAFWFSSQECIVRWRNACSSSFCVSNGTRQGGVLSPYLFTRYIRELIGEISCSNVGCKISGHVINILVYADDIVLIAPSWRALQKLLTILYNHAAAIDMSCNINKTVAMVFAPKNRQMVVCAEFPLLNIGNSFIQYVSNFKYLGHIITHNLLDDDDVHREVCNMYVRTNMLIRKFHKCSLHVKIL